METTLKPRNLRQLQDWETRLKDAGAPYKKEEVLGMTVITLDKEDARAILGQKANPVNKIVLYGLLLIFLVFGVTICMLPDAPAPELTWEEQIKEEYGMSSLWNAEYGMWVAREYCANPRSFRARKVHILPFQDTQDSIVHYLYFTAQNDFGVVKDHRIHSIVNTTTKTVRVVSVD